MRQPKVGAWSLPLNGSAAAGPITKQKARQTFSPTT